MTGLSIRLSANPHRKLLLKTDTISPRLPAEWEAQSAILITWPHADTDWCDMLEEVEADFSLMAKAILDFQPLIVLCANVDIKNKLTAELCNRKYPVHFHIFKSNDTWVRDYGPITCLENSSAIMHDFVFNGWGGKFFAEQDSAATASLSSGILKQNTRVSHNIVLEGGAIESNGKDCLLTTSTCLMTDTRNPQMSRLDWENLFAEQFGLKKTLWLDHGFLAGDDTDSHVDTLARFVAENHIAYVKCDDPSDIHYEALQAMEQQLTMLRNCAGEAFQLTALPWPATVRDPEDEHRLPATYANFLIINNAVLIPQYNDPMDSVAVERLGKCFPQRKMVPLPSLAYIRQHGSIHCLTMQLPVQIKLSDE